MVIITLMALLSLFIDKIPKSNDDIPLQLQQHPQTIQFHILLFVY